MAFGSWLKSKRDGVNLSQKEVADHLGYSSAQFVSNWERDLSTPPKHAIPKLTKLLNISEDELRQEIVKVKVAEVEKQWLSI